MPESFHPCHKMPEQDHSHNYYKHLYNVSPIGLVSLDNNGFIREINQPAAKLLGSDQKRLLNTSFLDFVTAETSDTFLNHLKQCKHSAEQVITEISISIKGYSNTLQLISIKDEDENGSAIYRTALFDTTKRLQQRPSGSGKPIAFNENTTDEEFVEENKRLKEELTKHLKAEDDLRKLSRAIEQSPCTVMITNAAGNIEYVNPKFTQLTGYTPEEVIGKNPRILKPDKIPSEKYTHLWKTILSGGEWRGEFCNKKKNGDLYWEYAYISPVKNQNGEITHFIGVKEDITERMRSEEKLRTLSRAIEQSPCTVLITNAKGIIEYVNPKFTQLTGYTADEVIGKNPNILKPNNIPSEKFNHLWKTITSGKEWHGKFCNKKKNGDLYWEYAYISPVKNQLGIITNFIAVKEDITERIKAEEELSKFLRAIEQSPSTVIITNSKGIIEYVNPRFTESTGYISDEVIGKNPRVLKPENISPEEFAELWKTLLTGKEWKGEFCYKKKTGETYWENAYISPIRNHEGKITHFIVVKEDITERKLVEEERIQHIKELEDLMSFSTHINDEEMEEGVFKHLVSALQKYFAPDIVAIAMLDKEKNMLYLPIIEPMMPGEELLHKEAMLDPSLCTVISTGEKLIVYDIAAGYSCECLETSGKNGGYICFPIIVGGKTAGMVLMIKRAFGMWKNEKTQRLMSNYIETAALVLHKLELLDIAKHTNVTDETTGIYNKRYFTEILTKHITMAKRRHENLSLLILGLDDYKSIIETYGPDTGRLILQQITGILSNSVSDSDIISRYDLDEFAIIMPATFTTRALVKADGIRQRIEYTDFKDHESEQTFNVMISIGIASFPAHATEAETLVKLANKAFYQAKNDGGNRVAALSNS
ncbi:MAG: PAS domain S-box protein [Planctomycetes bacterium]|nr:PAS domain S-box protein [Planctomycetota bacterium]